MERREILIIFSEFFLIIAAFSGYMESSIASSDAQTHRSTIASTQVATLEILEANRYCNKYYEATEYRNGSFFPSDSLQYSPKNISETMREMNVTFEDLSNNSSLQEEVRIRMLYDIAEETTPFEYYVKCQDEIGSSNKAINLTNSLYNDLNDKQMFYPYLAPIHVASLALALICLTLVVLIPEETLEDW